MALTNSTMRQLGSLAPSFSLLDVVSNKSISLNEIKGSIATVVMFICNHCPFVVHVNTQLVLLANDYKNRGVGFVAISANDVINYLEDAPDKMKIVAEKMQYPFPYLYDETQEVAKAFDAACTPDFFIYDSNVKLSYSGQLDDSRPGNGIAVTGSDIRKVLDCLINNEPVPAFQKPSIGCNIKWK